MRFRQFVIPMVTFPILSIGLFGGGEATTIEAGQATKSGTGQGVARRIPLRMKAKVVIGSLVADLVTGLPTSSRAQ